MAGGRRLALDPVVADRLLAVALLVLAQVELWALGAIPGPGWLGFVVTVVGTLPVAVRRAHPLFSVSAVMTAHLVLDVTYGPASSVALIASWVFTLYALAVWAGTRDFVVGCGYLLAMNVAAGLVLQSGIAGLLAFGGVPLVSAIAVRRIVRERDARAEALAARAELLEREQELRIREAAEAERATIARELHDVVAHKVSVMVVQAGAERSVLDPSNGGTVETLRTIEATGREALVELRRLLGVLRSGEPQSLAPQPTLDDVDALVEQIRTAGIDVDLILDGRPRPLAPGLELSAFRIIQEALTNVLKHAGGARAHVTVRFAADELEIEVRDDGGRSDAAGPGTGHGLLGIRERVALHGGRLDVGPTGQGFVVRAWLPAGA